jgi:hypothetical protein
VTPAEIEGRLLAAGRFLAVADVLRPLAKNPDAQLARKAAELEAQARSIAGGIRDAVLLATVGCAS